VSADRVTKIRIEGLRAVADATFDLEGLTVLIGDNGTGKSTVLEALELVRKAATPSNFTEDVLRVHGGLRDLLTRGAKRLRLTVTVVTKDVGTIVYSFALGLQGTSDAIISESAELYVPDLPVRKLISRSRDQGQVEGQAAGKFQPVATSPELLLGASFASINPALVRLFAALRAIDYHVPFETRPLWQQAQLDVRTGPRWPSAYDRHERLGRYGVNLASCVQQLRNGPRDAWDRVVERAQLGLGHDLRDLIPEAAGRGNVDLSLLFGRWPEKPLPVRALSEGQISYLMMIVMIELGAGRSLLAFDEPELHLHPGLLSRVTYMFEQLAETCPVILATQSDQLLDALAEPSKSVVLCEQSAEGITFRRPNQDALQRWLESYRGLGSVRSEGYEEHVFDGGPFVGVKEP
jgi:predicted ATPase